VIKIPFLIVYMLETWATKTAMLALELIVGWVEERNPTLDITDI
jgi:hypothetical protein